MLEEAELVGLALGWCVGSAPVLLRVQSILQGGRAGFISTTASTSARNPLERVFLACGSIKLWGWEERGRSESVGVSHTE